MKKAQLEALMEKNFVFTRDIDYICDFISGVLEAKAKETEEEYPYATKTIQRYKDVAYEVFNLTYELYEILEGEDE
jgi:hypothetical protein